MVLRSAEQSGTIQTRTDGTLDIPPVVGVSFSKVLFMCSFRRDSRPKTLFSSRMLLSILKPNKGGRRQMRGNSFKTSGTLSMFGGMCLVKFVRLVIAGRMPT